MALTNSQYNEIIREYERRQLDNRHLMSKRLEKAFALSPRLKEIDKEIASTSVRQAAKLLDGNKEALNELKNSLRSLKEEREAIIASLGFPKNYFDPIYTCPICQDTGYVNGQKCKCFKQAIINTVYSQSNIREILSNENFSTFTYDYYSADIIPADSNLSELATAQNAVAECKLFINDFDNKPKNLFFFGNIGTGKTFLSNCVAKELLDLGYSVIYFTAFQLFDILSKGVFDRDADAIAANQNIFDCDLLIIDDLGTELSNTFTTSQLFLCVNERILRQKSTIISTNLSLQQIRDEYSERTLSRILSNYSLIKLIGDDIRVKKRQRN